MLTPFDITKLLPALQAAGVRRFVWQGVEIEFQWTDEDEYPAREYPVNAAEPAEEPQHSEPPPELPKPDPRKIIDDVFEDQMGSEGTSDFRKHPLLWGGPERVPHFPDKGSVERPNRASSEE